MLLERRARALRRHLSSAVAGDYTGVHQARVATRRLREAVPVLTAGVKGTKARKAGRKIRRLTRALGTVRELDVTLRILDELADRPDIPRSAVDDLRAHVIATRDRRRALMLERLEEVNSEKLGRRLKNVADALSACPETWRVALAARLLTRSKRLQDAVSAAGRIYVPEPLHQVRIAAKKLRYALEIADELGVRDVRPLVRTLKRAQTTLGRLHDLQVLQQHVADVQGHAGLRHGATMAGLDAMSRALEGECRRLHARYLAAAPALLELAAECRATIVPPLSGAARRARRPLKMSLPAARRARRHHA
jgi:CHAD domain-containing protein